MKNPEPILALAQPAIRILTRRAEEQDINHIHQSFGHSHFGGRPDLPKDMGWPRYKDRPMAFIGQINVDDIGMIPGRSDLPEHGILYFFSAFAWGEDYSDGLDYEDPTNTQVIYYEGPLDLEHLWPQHAPHGMPPISTRGWGLYPYTTLQFAAHLSLPSPEEVSELPDGISPEIYEEIYYDFTFLTNDHVRHAPQHQLLGYAWPIQGFSTYEDEMLLIQFDTDYWEADFQWGDGGMLYFSLPKSDLQQRDFSHCRCSYECG